MAGTFRRVALRSSTAVGLTLFVAACDVSPVFQSPVFPFASAYSGQAAGTPVLLRNEAWWQRFNDPVLDALIAQGLRDSLELSIARERVVEAQALAETIPSEVTLTGGARAGRGGTDPTDYEADATFGFDWLLDPWGGRKAQIRAAEARAEVAQAELNAAQLLLLSNIATAYIDLRFFERSLQLRQTELASRRKTLELIEQLQAANEATRLEVVRAQALVSQTRSLIPSFQTAIQVQENRLAVLLGQPPSQMALPIGKQGQPLAGLPANIGIPADLLRNRPDLRIAERAYYASVADIGSARADLYPTLSLGGELTLSSIGGVSGTDFFFGPALQLPALPNGSRKAQVEVQESQARQALTSWKATVITALGEVEDALVSYSGSHKAVGASRETVRLYAEAVQLTRDLIGRSGATIRDLLDDERSVAEANIRLAQNLRDLGTDFVVLNVSLGAGSEYLNEQDVASAE